MDIKSRIRNKAFLLSVIAFVVLIVKTFTDYQFPANFDTIVNSGLGILTALGIVIDPSTPGVLDKAQENEEGE